MTPLPFGALVVYSLVEATFAMWAELRKEKLSGASEPPALPQKRKLSLWRKCVQHSRSARHFTSMWMYDVDVRSVRNRHHFEFTAWALFNLRVDELSDPTTREPEEGRAAGEFPPRAVRTVAGKHGEVLFGVKNKHTPARVFAYVKRLAEPTFEIKHDSQIFRAHFLTHQPYGMSRWEGDNRSSGARGERSERSISYVVQFLCVSRHVRRRRVPFERTCVSSSARELA